MEASNGRHPQRSRAPAEAPPAPQAVSEATGAAAEAAGNVAGTAKEQARQVTGEVSAQARSVAADVRDRVADEARTQTLKEDAQWLKNPTG
jgi:uncharacterized protein YjbJ (UPF0337 family)